MRIKLFTHTDLDGVSCAVVLKYVMSEAIIDVSYCDYNEINDAVKEFVQSGEYENYDRVFITDISVNSEVGDMLDSLYHVSVFDHHATAEWMNKYSWATIRTHYSDRGGEPTCGTSLLYDYLQSISTSCTDTYLGQYVNFVRMWDTWKWTEDESKFRMSEYLSILCNLQEHDVFVDGMIATLQAGADDVFQLCEYDMTCIINEIQRRDDYVDNVSKSSIVPDDLMRGHRYVCAFADEYTSIVGNRLLRDNPGCMYAVIISLQYKTISFRTTSDTFNTAIELAKPLGGGGHPKSSGCPLPVSVESVIDFILNP